MIASKFLFALAEESRHTDRVLLMRRFDFLQKNELEISDALHSTSSSPRDSVMDEVEYNIESPPVVVPDVHGDASESIELSEPVVIEDELGAESEHLDFSTDDSIAADIEVLRDFEALSLVPPVGEDPMEIEQPVSNNNENERSLCAKLLDIFVQHNVSNGLCDALLHLLSAKVPELPKTRKGLESIVEREESGRMGDKETLFKNLKDDVHFSLKF